MNVLWIGNDQTLEVSGLRDVNPSGSPLVEYLNNATVTAIIKNLNGSVVAGQGSPGTITLDYVPDTDGIYQGSIDDSVQFQPDTFYIIEITADAGGDLIGFWRFKRMAEYRTA